MLVARNVVALIFQLNFVKWLRYISNIYNLIKLFIIDNYFPLELYILALSWIIAIECYWNEKIFGGIWSPNYFMLFVSVDRLVWCL
jgi:hypothetical protein